MLSLLLAVPSCIYSFWHGVIPTSYFIFNDFYTCFTNFLISLDCSTDWPASLPYIRKIHVSVTIGTQSGIRLHERVRMVKIWGSSKNDQNWTTGKLLKFENFIFTILHLLLVVVVVLLLLLLQFQLMYLKNCTELRHETLCTDRYP